MSENDYSKRYSPGRKSSIKDEKLLSVRKKCPIFTSTISQKVKFQNQAGIETPPIRSDIDCVGQCELFWKDE